MKLRRLLSLLLALVLVLGIVPTFPTAVQAAEPEQDRSAIRLDFKQTAIEASKQSWWNDLRAAGNDATKFFGSHAYNNAMTAAQIQAYTDLRAWLDETRNWNFNETKSRFTTAGFSKALFLNADPNVPWGICYRSMFHSMERSSLFIDVTVPEGGAGMYNLVMDIFRETTSYASPIIGAAPGGGYLDIIINGQLVYDEYYFGGPNTRAEENLGPVELLEGVNTIELYSTRGFTATTSNNERCVYDICAMEFEPLTGLQAENGQKSIHNLRNSYFAYNTVIDESYTAEVANGDLLRAGFDADGNLVLTGLGEGETELTVYKDGSELITIPVTIGPKTSMTYDFSKASALTGDGFHVIGSYEDLDVDDVLSDNWRFADLEADGAYWSAENSAAVLKSGAVEFTLEVTESSWYEPSLNLFDQPQGGKAYAYLDDAYLGTLQTKADAKSLRTQSLRPLYLEAGEYTLHLQASPDSELWWSSLRLKQIEEPSLTLSAPALSGKQLRKLSCDVTAAWSLGQSDDLTDAVWSLSYDESKLSASMDGTTLTVAGLVPGAHELTVTAEVSGVSGSVTVPVNVLEPSPLVSAEVALPTVAQDQIARNTSHTFAYTLIAEDGDNMTPDEVSVSYELDEEGIVALDEQTHTFTGLADGTVNITVTVRGGDVELVRTFPITVADAGGNLLDTISANFEADEWTDENWDWNQPWNSSSLSDADIRFVNTDVIEEENGNHAMRFTFNPNSTYNTKSAGAKLNTIAGRRLALEPGRLYEASVLVRTEGIAYPKGTNVMLLYQSYDYTSNTSNTLRSEIYESVAIPQEQGQWTRLKVRIHAPVEADGPLYYMSCFVIRPSSTIYHDMTGFSGSVYVDDIEVREVGFDRVEMRLSQNMNDNRTTATLFIEPYSTSDEVILLDSDRMDLVQVENTNPQVVSIEGGITMAAGTNSTNVPTIPVRLTGLNDEASIVSTITIHGVEQTCTLDMTQTTLNDEILTADYKANGLDAITLSVGSTAAGDLTAVTTQLEPKTEEQLRKEGSVFFKSADESVVTVDQATGDLTAVGEGTTTVTGYSYLGGITKSDTITVVVTDDTDLASIAVSYSRNYIGTGQEASLQVSGLKASGADADMSLYPITWSVDDDTLATVSDEGRFIAIAPGQVTVTASAGINDSVISGSFTMTIVDNSQMPGEDYAYLLHHGRVLVLENGSLEQDGIALNEALTNVSLDFSSAHGLSVHPFYPGQQVALDFMIRKSGWYSPYNIGTSFSWGGLTDVYIDDQYVGQSDFASEFASYSNGNPLGAIWLEAGKHTIRLLNVRSGYLWWGGIGFNSITDPGQIQPKLDLKQTLLVGESVEAKVNFDMDGEGVFYMKNEPDASGEYTNVYTLVSGAPNVVRVEGNTLTAVAPGTATIMLAGEINHEFVSCEIEITVITGTVLRAELSAERTTVKPDSEPVQLSLKAYDFEETELGEEYLTDVTYESKHPEIATVDQSGLVTITGQTGSAQIIATIRDQESVVTAAIWISVTTGKTQPTLYTWEEREIARENVLKYDWAWNQKEAVVKEADFVVENLDFYYDRITREGLPRNGRIGKNGDPGVTTCPACQMDLSAIYNHYPWITDPINDPWKIQCPQCFARFPSNDFASFYKLGLDEQGYFSRERALENGGEQYLVNELYPEKGAGWGVDDGFGWETGNTLPSDGTEVRYFVAYYHLTTYYPLGNSKYDLLSAMENLRDAYLYTGDEQYAIAGSILLDRFADVYREFDYFNNSISRDRGKIVDYIWEGLNYQQMFATCADAFWPCMDDPQVIDYLRQRHVLKGIEDPETITPEYLREHIDNDILLVIKWAIENGQSKGNAGMTEAAMAYTAVALDRLPESDEMIDWIFRQGEFTIIDSGTGSAKWTGGSVMANMVSRVNRDGLGDEGSIAYNRMWYQNYIKIADALSGYGRVEGADLWQNSKFLDMFIAMNKVTVLGNSVVTTGETGYMQASSYYPQVSYLLQLFANTHEDQVAHRQAAQIIYAGNNHSVDGLHGDIFTKDPEHGIRSEIQAIVNEIGEWNASESDMLCGEGLALLRNGPDKLIRGVNDDEFSDYWMFFGLNGAAHGAWEALSLGIDAYGLSFTGGTGYPVVVNSGSAPREHWMRGTLSHNTVTVDLSTQNNISKNSFPLHFDDAGKVKVIDAEAAQAYSETEIYRRTLVSVELENEEYYAVDFFRVLGGRDHVYSFHVHGKQVNETAGLELTHQPMGTYAGADVPLGAWYPNPYAGDTASNVRPFGSNTGASWLDNVYRDTTPETAFTVDFAIEDFHHRLTSTNGLGLRLTMLSDEPMTEVAIADGHPDQNGYNPEYVKYLLVNHSGSNDLDTMYTSVIEPYQVSHRITSSELVEVTLVDGEETFTDKAVAVKVTRKDGQEDYIVYATNNTCTYNVAGLFDFRGFTGVASYVNGTLVYAYGNDATQVGDVIEDTLPAITGQVVSFTEGLSETYTMTVKVDQAVTERDFDGRYIYVNNDRAENGAYRIYGAEVNGDTVVLDLFTQSLARRYVDGTNMDLGFVHNVEPGQTFTIPLSNVFDAGLLFNYMSDTMIKAGNKFTVTTGVAGSGVNYKAEGLPAGAKLSAADGTISWTPTAAQAGRYTITVYAMDGSTVLGEMSFVLYVVNYTGSTYPSASCAHAKAVTYTVDGIIETVCPACGTISKRDANATEKFDLAGANMTLGNELKLNFLVKTADLADGEYTAKITHNGEVTETVFTRYNSGYQFVSYTVSAKQMADTISVVVCDESGNEVSNVYETSVRTYAMNLLGNKTLGSAVKTLVVDMLNYGAEAQNYFSYNTEDLANSLLTDEQKALATAAVTCTNKQVKGQNFYGANLSLEDRILLNIFFKNVTEGMTAKVTYTDYAGTAKSFTKELVQHSGNIYKVIIDEIVLADAFSPVTVTVYNADGTIHGSGTDSVESYIARTGNSALNEAIMKFAWSAKNYLG